MPSFRRHPVTAFKLFSAAFIICFYLIYASFRDYFSPPPKIDRIEIASLQYEGWRGGGKADLGKAGIIRDAMRKAFASYQDRAWGKDEIRPISGGNVNNHNGWGAFLVESTSTLALMGLWDELREAVRYIIDKVDFTKTDELVDPSETIRRYLGAILSLVDMSDAGLISPEVIAHDDRNKLLGQAYTLAFKLRPSFDTNTGLPWPRVDFDTSVGTSLFTPKDGNPEEENIVTIPLSSASAPLLESRVLSRLTNDASYLEDATYAIVPLLWPSYNLSALPNHPDGLFPSPLNIDTSHPTAQGYSWDTNHLPFYTALLKSLLLSPHSRHAPTYRTTWLSATHALRWNLTSRSAASPTHATSHLYLSQRSGPHLLNEASHTSCAAPASLLLGGAALSRPDLIGLGQALLEGCHHVHASSPSGLAPDRWSWTPAGSERGDPAFEPSTKRAARQWELRAWWAVEERGGLRAGYVESLFVAWRVTGQARYRQWAWEAWEAVRARQEARYGFAALKDVMRGKATSSELGVVEQAMKQAGVELVDEQETEWMSRTLKFLWLLFGDVKVADLDMWVISEGGHLFRRTEPG
ncbi:glycoside hydrolase family 47 protein [Viridothelium virens]|uniref:alpha-1,2-Mannosidase n=1 Tax=Viridothelium virens TaxID=1048519 RepID=A0A6A6GSW0_VIRVR|nr:glycoside hydrolase family 47 protein [Viridothelium virens]